MKKEIGIHELYRLDPERADYLLWGRHSDPVTRRGFVRGLAGITGVIGAGIVYHHTMPAGLIRRSWPIRRKRSSSKGKTACGY